MRIRADPDPQHWTPVKSTGTGLKKAGLRIRENLKSYIIYWNFFTSSFFRFKSWSKSFCLLDPDPNQTFWIRHTDLLGKKSDHNVFKAKSKKFWFRSGSGKRNDSDPDPNLKKLEVKNTSIFYRSLNLAA